MTEPGPSRGEVVRAAIHAARDGDRSAIQQLCGHATPVLEQAARDLMGEALRARYNPSDLVQSTLIEAVTSLRVFRGETGSEFVRWTVRILENNVRDRRRFSSCTKRATAREQAGLDLDLLLGGGGRTPSQYAIDREQLVLVAAALRRLPPDQRRVIQLTILRGMSHAEAARELQRSEGACRVLLARARAALLVELEKTKRRRRAD